MPSKMNPVEEDNNQFAELFKAMPAGRIGKLEDIAGAVIYLSSQAGVSSSKILEIRPQTNPQQCRHILMVDACVSMVDASC